MIRLRVGSRAWIGAAVAAVGFALLHAGVALGQHGSDAGVLAPEEVEESGQPFDAGSAPSVTLQPMVTDAATAIASGRGLSVTAGELYQRIADAPEPTQRVWAATPALLEEVIDRMIADRLMANEARRLGLDRDPAVRAAVDRALVARLRATVVNSAAGDASRVTSEDIREFYDSHSWRFHIPERRTARVIFVTERRDAEHALRRARAMRRHRLVNDFRMLAQELNTDPELIRENGEVRDVTPVQTDLDPALREAIYEIHAPGEVALNIVRGSWRGTRGFFIVRLSARRAPIDRTLAESSDWIRQRIVLQRRVDAERTMVARLTSDARVVRTPSRQLVRVSGGSGVVDAGTAPSAN